MKKEVNPHLQGKEILCAHNSWSFFPIAMETIVAYMNPASDAGKCQFESTYPK